MKNQLFELPNQLLSQITTLRKISSTDRFPCFSCFDEKMDRITCRVCVGSGFIYGSHPMVQFSEDFIEKKISYLKKQQAVRNDRLDNWNMVDKNISLSKSIDQESVKFNEEQTKKLNNSKIQNVSIQIESNKSNQLKSNEQQVKDERMSSIKCEDERNETIVHHGYCCDECDEDPIIGYRYHCGTCQDYDLCSKCFKKNTHNHQFILFRQTEGAIKAIINPHHNNLLKSIRGSYRKIS